MVSPLLFANGVTLHSLILCDETNRPIQSVMSDVDYVSKEREERNIVEM